MNRWTAISLVIVFLILGGCAPDGTDARRESVPDFTDDNVKVTVVHSEFNIVVRKIEDVETGVLCYTFRDGISCVAQTGR